ncbi:hypothetical protein [Companilactobacillus paralimentarius]|uniref:hypothetical protein n=1 Tax=Companilactobacillus paralimentarius TaxID=83526 RepID=UPI0037E0007F
MEGKRGSECLLKPVSNIDFNPLLNIFFKEETESKFKFDISKMPARINKKLIFNNAPKHKLIFANHSITYGDFEETIHEFPDSQKIIQKLMDIFYKYAEVDSNGKLIVSNGDNILFTMRDDIKKIIVNDKDFDPNIIADEQIDDFVVAFLTYGVSECKVLVNPN